VLGKFVALLLPLLALAFPQPGVAAVQPRVLIVTTFQYGDPAAAGTVGEAQRWVSRDRLSRRIPVPGLPSPLFCNGAQTECLIVTGMGKVNAASSILVLGQSGTVDLRSSYILLAGIAGTAPDAASVGSVAWAGWIVDGDLAHEIDPREPFTSERFSRSRLGCNGEPWCAAGWRTGTEVFALDARQRDWAYHLTRAAVLHDSAKVRRFRARYRDTKYGNRPPEVRACDVITSDTYWQGERMSAFAGWWVAKWTNGRGAYCMSAMEDSGLLGGLQRLAQRGRADLARVMILRGASDYDSPSAGQSPAQSLRASATTGGFELALENVYLTGEIAVTKLLARVPPAQAAPVTVVVHVPLTLNTGARTPPGIIAGYEREFRALGGVVDHPGVGSWMPSGGGRLTFDADDHVFITTTAARARAFLATFLPRLRRDVHQDSALGEILDGWYGSVAEERRRVEVVLPLTCQCEARIRAIHLLFGKAGGASQYDDLSGTHIYSSVMPQQAGTFVNALHRMHLESRVTRSTFVLAG
jgi:purine nucleoside permease